MDRNPTRLKYRGWECLFRSRESILKDGEKSEKIYPKKV
jgi:hypothetical protein